MRLIVPKERVDGERRVAAVPTTVSKLAASGATVVVESGAGEAAGYPDASYAAAGAELAAPAALYDGADLVCKVRAPGIEEVGRFPEGVAVVSFFQPNFELDVVDALVDRRITSFSLDLLPRISRAQSMDALSSQSTVTGYRGVLIAATHLQKFFPMFMTAAGTIPPAKVLVLGVGVAGLQAIATARRLGAVVRAYDVRPAAREEVRSLGAAFVELGLESQEGEGGYAREQSEDFLARQRELIGKEVAAADAIITTAAVPGRKAPVLVTAAMAEQMAPGAVLIDLAAESGGNCELSIPGEEVPVGGATVIGVKNLASQMAYHASFLYARNIAEFVSLVARDGKVSFDWDDEIVAESCVTHAGEVRNELTRELVKERSS